MNTSSSPATGRLARRDFLRLGAAFGFSAGMGAAFRAGAAPKAAPALKVTRHSIKVGAERPFKFVHVSDTHLALCDSRDGERKQKLAAGRFRFFRRAEHYFDEAVRFARDEGAELIHTGDMIDFTSAANFDAASEHFGEAPFFACAGNHEFSQFVGEAVEDAAYKAQSFDSVQANFPNDLVFASRIVNGVDFVAFDNVYYNVTERQAELFEKEVEKGLPIVLMCHVPFYSEELFRRQIARTKGSAAYLCGVPESLTSKFSEKRAVQQRTDDVTRDFVARVRSEPLVRAVLCGHIHTPEFDRFSPTACTYAAGATFHGDVSLIDFS